MIRPLTAAVEASTAPASEAPGQHGELSAWARALGVTPRASLDRDTVRRQARRVLARAGGRPGHIFNLGHGVIPETDPDDLCRLVDLVHERTIARSAQ